VESTASTSALQRALTFSMREASSPEENPLKNDAGSASMRETVAEETAISLRLSTRRSRSVFTMPISAVESETPTSSVITIKSAFMSPLPMTLEKMMVLA